MDSLRVYKERRGMGGLGYISIPGSGSVGAAAANLQSSREILKKDLQSRLHFDDPSVFRRLGLAKVPEDLVTRIAASFHTDNSDSISILKEVVADAERRPLGSLEGEKQKAEEMYQPLEQIFSYIEQFPGGAAQSHNRHFASTDSKKMKGEDHMLGFPHNDPDFTCRDPGIHPADVHLWRHSSAFAEIKPSQKQGPKAQIEGKVLSLVVQSADYSRLHMAARPFQLFTVGLLIFGTSFCAVIFDRYGVTFSPIYDMWMHTDVFIRLVRRISCDLSPVELGQDPTASMLPDNSALYQIIKPKAQALAQNSSFPSYIVGLGGDSPRRWVTIGPPLWVSVSLNGRGSAVWRVCGIDKNQVIDIDNVYVMKSAWRHSGRDSESEIYARIPHQHPGVAVYEDGSDVAFPGKPGEVISVDALRGNSEPTLTGTPVLHRLILRTLGRPVWDSDSEVELLKGFRAALQGHKFLTDNGILHRDISAGNIMLSASSDPPVGAEGFLADLEFAYTLNIREVTTTVTNIPPVKKPSGQYTEPTQRTHTHFAVSAARGADMTGTIQFMAIEVLTACLKRKRIPHKIHHDLESFLWVLGYAVWRRLLYDLNNPSEDLVDLRNQCVVEFHDAFGFGNGRITLLSRRAFAPFLLPDDIPDDLISQPLKQMFEQLRGVLYQTLAPINPVPLTYEKMFTTFDDTILQLEG